MTRLSEISYGPFRIPKGLKKKRFHSIFSKRSSGGTEEEEAQSRFRKIGLHPVDRVRLSEANSTHRGDESQEDIVPPLMKQGINGNDDLNIGTVDEENTKNMSTAKNDVQNGQQATTLIGTVNVRDRENNLGKKANSLQCLNQVARLNRRTQGNQEATIAGPEKRGCNDSTASGEITKSESDPQEYAVAVGETARVTSERSASTTSLRDAGTVEEIGIMEALDLEEADASNIHLNNCLNEADEFRVSTQEYIRMYIDSKIKEAIQAHETKHHATTLLRHNAKALPANIKIGPLYILNQQLTSLARSTVLLMYFGIALFLALAGPRISFLWAWKVVTVLSIYEIATRELGWKDDEAPDVILEPVKRGIDALVYVYGNTTMRLGFWVEDVVVKMARGVHKDSHGGKDRQ